MSWIILPYRSVRVWLKRDSGQFWPSICHYLPSGATSVCYAKETKKIFVGQENGTVSVSKRHHSCHILCRLSFNDYCFQEFILAEDYNSVVHKRDYLSHHARVAKVHYEATPAWILSVGRDKWFQYYCSNTGKRLGGHICQSWVLSLEYVGLGYLSFAIRRSQIFTTYVLIDSTLLLVTCSSATLLVRSRCWD